MCCWWATTTRCRCAWPGRKSSGYGNPRTDFYYAELSEADADSWDADGDHRWGEDYGDTVDFYNEVNVGRIPWSDPATVSSICAKSVAFELNSDPAFKKNILLIGSFFWEDTDTAVLMEAKCWTSPGWPTGPRCGCTSRTAPSTPTIPCDFPMNHANVMDSWSNGTFCFVNWAGHGSPWSSHIMGHGSQAYIETSDCPPAQRRLPVHRLGRLLLQQRHRRGESRPGDAEAAGRWALWAPPRWPWAPGSWSDPYDGSSQSCDYWFTTKVTSGEMTQGEAHQYSLRQNYTNGLWDVTEYEMLRVDPLGQPRPGVG